MCSVNDVMASNQSKQTKNELIPLESLAALPQKSLIALSRDGSRIAYREKTDNFDGIVVIDAKSYELITAVKADEVQPTGIRFVTNDTLLLNIDSKSKYNSYFSRGDSSLIYVLNIQTSKIFQLLSPGHGVASQRNLGKLKGFNADRTQAYMMAYDNNNRHNMYRVKLDKKSTPRVVRRGTADTIDMFMIDDEVVARERFNNDSNIHQVESKLDGEWVDIFRENTPFINKLFAGFTGDRQALVMIATDGKTGRRAYHSVSLKTGDVSKPLFSRSNKGVETVIRDENDVILGVRYSGFKPEYDFFDKKLNARFRGLKTAMPFNTFNLLSWTEDRNNMLLMMEGELSSGQFIRYANGALEHIAFARPLIAPEIVSYATSYEFKARDGLTIPSLLTLPLHHEGNNLPAIVMPHGGPESYDKIEYNWLVQYFTNRGYAVIQPQFRGSEGFGREFTLAGRGEWGRKMQDDITDSIQYFANQKTIDPKRVCIVGWSYGGYAAMAGIALTPELYQCAIAINGVSDIPMMIARDRKEYGRKSSTVEYWDAVIVNGKLTKEELKASSPARNAKFVKAPLLLVHGTYDNVVHIEQSEEMHDMLEDMDKAVKMVKIEKGDHNLYTAKHRLKLLTEVDRFIRQHLPIKE